MVSQTERLQATRQAQLESQRRQLKRSKRLQVSQEARRKGKTPERVLQEQKVEKAKEQLTKKRKQSAKEISEKLKKAGTIEQVEKVYSELPKEVRKFVSVTPSKVKQQVKEREKKIEEEIKKAEEKIKKYKQREREADSQRREDNAEERLEYYKDYKKGLQKGKSRLQKGQLLTEKEIKDFADDMGDAARNEAQNRNERNRQRREYKEQGLTELPSGEFVDLTKLGFSDRFAGETISKRLQKNLGIEISDEGISRDLSATFSKGAREDLIQRFAKEAKTIQKEKGVSFKEAQKLARKQTQLGGIPQGFEIELQEQKVKKEQKKLEKTFEFDVPERTELKGDISQFDTTADFTGTTKSTVTTPTRTVEQLQAERERERKLVNVGISDIIPVSGKQKKVQKLREKSKDIQEDIFDELTNIQNLGAVVSKPGKSYKISGIENLSEEERKKVNKALDRINKLSSQQEKISQDIQKTTPEPITFMGETISQDAIGGISLFVSRAKKGLTSEDPFAEARKELGMEGDSIFSDVKAGTKQTFIDLEKIFTAPFDITGEVAGISAEKATQKGLDIIPTVSEAVPSPRRVGRKTGEIIRDPSRITDIFSSKPEFVIDTKTGEFRKAKKGDFKKDIESIEQFQPGEFITKQDISKFTGTVAETTVDIGKFAVPVLGEAAGGVQLTAGLARADFSPVRFAKEEPLEVAGLATFGLLKLKGLKKARRATKIEELTKTQPELTIGVSRRGDDFTDVLVAGKRIGKGSRAETIQKFRLGKIDDTVSRVEAGKSSQKVFTDSLLFSDAKVDVSDLTFFGKVRRTTGRKVRRFGDDFSVLTKGDDITGLTFAESRINVLDDALKGRTIRGGGVSRKRGEFTEFITGKLDDLDKVGKARLQPSGFGVIKRTDEDIATRINLQPRKTSQVAPTDINKILGTPTKRLELGKTIDKGAFAKKNLKNLDDKLSGSGKVTQQVSKIDKTDLTTVFSTIEREGLEQTAKAIGKGAKRTNLLSGFALGTREVSLDKFKPAVGLSDISASRKTTKTKIKPKFKAKDITQQVELKSTDLAELEDTSFKFDTAQAVDTSTIQRTSTITDTATAVTDITITPDITTEIKPPWPNLDFGRGKQKTSKKKGVYDVYTKRAGRRVKITEEPLPKERALDVGSYVTDNSIAAQFSIKKAKRKRKTAKRPKQKILFGSMEKQFDAPYNYWKLQGRRKFRDFKKVKGRKKKLRNTWIEQDNLRLDTAGEVNKITAKRLVSRNKKSSANLAKSQKNLSKVFGL